MVVVCRAICEFPRKEVTFEAPSFNELMRRMEEAEAQQQMKFYVDRWIPLSNITHNNTAKLGECIDIEEFWSFKFLYKKELNNIYYNNDTQVRISEENLQLQQSLFGNEFTVEARLRRPLKKFIPVPPALGKRSNPFQNQENTPSKLGKNENGEKVASGSNVRIIVKSVHARPDGQVEIFISPSKTIKELTQEVATALGGIFSPEQMVLSFKGNALLESSSVEDYNIGNGDIIDVSSQELGDTQSDSSFRVDIHTLSSGRFSVEVETCDTIHDVKVKIQEDQGIPVIQQRLIFAGRQLEDRGTLLEYDIVSPVQMRLALRLRGGMYHVASGFSNTTGEFLFTNIRLNGETVPVHTAWTHDELLEHVSEAMKTENVATCLTQKFKKTAISFRLRELEKEENRLATELADFKVAKRNVLTAMLDVMEEHLEDDDKEDEEDEDGEGTEDEDGTE